METELTLSIYIDNCFQNRQPEIQTLLQQSTLKFFNRYHSQHQYQLKNFTRDLENTFQSFSLYSEILQKIMLDFKPYQKIGSIQRTINKCTKQIISFIKEELNGKKFLLSSNVEEQTGQTVPLICKRCQNFLLQVNVEETKLQLGVGQFKDYYNLFTFGQPEYRFSKLSKKQENENVLYAQIWKNKKSIEEKLLQIQVKLQKKQYGLSYDVKRFQNTHKLLGQELQKKKIHIKQNNRYSVSQHFDKNMIILVNNIYEKIKNIQKLEKQKKMERQTQTQVQYKEYNHPEMEKMMKKNKDLRQTLSQKNKENNLLKNKIRQKEKLLEQVELEKNSVKTVLKSVMNQKYARQAQLETKLSDINLLKQKISSLTKSSNSKDIQIQELKTYIKRLKNSKKNFPLIKQTVSLDSQNFFKQNHKTSTQRSLKSFEKSIEVQENRKKKVEEDNFQITKPKAKLIRKKSSNLSMIMNNRKEKEKQSNFINNKGQFHKEEEYQSSRFENSKSIISNYNKSETSEKQKSQRSLLQLQDQQVSKQTISQRNKEKQQIKKKVKFQKTSEALSDQEMIIQLKGNGSEENDSFQANKLLSQKKRDLSSDLQKKKQNKKDKYNKPYERQTRNSEPRLKQNQNQRTQNNMKQKRNKKKEISKRQQHKSMKEVHLGDPHEVKNKNNGKLRKTVGNLLKKKKVSMHLHKNFSFSQLSLISTPKVESKIEEETPSKEEEQQNCQQKEKQNNMMTLYMEFIKQKGINLKYKVFKKQIQHSIQNLINNKKFETQKSNNNIRSLKHSKIKQNQRSRENFLPKNFKLMNDFDKGTDRQEQYKKTIKKMVQNRQNKKISLFKTMTLEKASSVHQQKNAQSILKSVKNSNHENSCSSLTQKGKSIESQEKDITNLFFSLQEALRFEKNKTKSNIINLNRHQQQFGQIILAKIAELHLKNQNLYQKVKNLLIFPYSSTYSGSSLVEVLKSQSCSSSLKDSLYEIINNHRIVCRKQHEICKHLSLFLSKLNKMLM